MRGADPARPGVGLDRSPARHGPEMSEPVVPRAQQLRLRENQLFLILLRHP